MGNQCTKKEHCAGMEYLAPVAPRSMDRRTQVLDKHNCCIRIPLVSLPNIPNTSSRSISYNTLAEHICVPRTRPQSNPDWHGILNDWTSAIRYIPTTSTRAELTEPCHSPNFGCKRDVQLHMGLSFSGQSCHGLRILHKA